jgi:two-component system, sensor histidine kinase and response regulator
MTGTHCSTQPRILIAEDNPINQEVIFEQLHLLGEVAEIAADGRQALDCWRQHHHLLVLTDLQMPHMDGYQLARAIRSEEAARGLPRTVIAVLTAKSAAGARPVDESDMDDHLSKPIHLEALQAFLTRWLPPAGAAGAHAHETATRPPAAVGQANTADRPADRVLDPATLRQYVGDDPVILRQFQQDFQQRLDASRVELMAAWKAEDHLQLGRLAHRLKSAARTVGALQLATACDDLEDAVQAQVPAAVALRWAEVQQAVTAAGAALRSELDASAP